MAAAKFSRMIFSREGSHLRDKDSWAAPTYLISGREALAKNITNHKDNAGNVIGDSFNHRSACFS